MYSDLLYLSIPRVWGDGQSVVGGGATRGISGSGMSVRICGLILGERERITLLTQRNPYTRKIGSVKTCLF